MDSYQKKPPGNWRLFNKEIRAISKNIKNIFTEMEMK